MMFVPAALRRSATGRRAIEALSGLIAETRRDGFVFGRFPRYRNWLKTVHDAAPSPATHGPRISVLVPVFNPEPRPFKAMLAALAAQTYNDFEVVLCDDASTSKDSRALLDALPDPRFKRVAHETNQGIARATNTAFARASGDIIAFVDQDDRVAPDALAHLARAFAAAPQAVYAYSDEDKLDARGRRCDPYFKPDFDRALLYRRNYINHLSAIRSDALRTLGGLDGALNGAQDYDLVLRTLEAYGSAGFTHVPRVLYHWRTGAWARGVSRRLAPLAEQARKRALEAHLSRIGAPAPVRAGAELEPLWPVPKGLRVSVIIPFRDRAALTRTCLDHARRGAGALSCEWILVDNDSQDPETLEWLEAEAQRGDTRVVRAPGAFNFSHLINRGAAASTGELLLILNNDVQGGAPGWIETLAGEALQPWAGATGVKLVYPDGRLQHGGVALGLGGAAGHVMKHAKPGEAGPFGHLTVTRTVSAVTGACLMVRRTVFDAVGGLDEAAFPVALNDVDFCLRAARAGFSAIWTPKVTLVHAEGASRGRETGDEPRLRTEIETFKRRWGSLLGPDPYLSANLSHQSETLGLAWPRDQTAKPPLTQ